MGRRNRDLDWRYRPRTQRSRHDQAWLRRYWRSIVLDIGQMSKAWYSFLVTCTKVLFESGIERACMRSTQANQCLMSEFLFNAPLTSEHLPNPSSSATYFSRTKFDDHEPSCVSSSP